jgi:hypothetical protein
LRGATSAADRVIGVIASLLSVEIFMNEATLATGYG